MLPLISDNTMRIYTSPLVVTLLQTGMLVGTFCGCRPQEEVTTYTSERTSAPQKSVDPHSLAQQLDRFLVAILPQGNKAWFFKLSGPTPAIERQRSEFISFVETISHAEADSGQQDLELSWSLPEGWKEEKSDAEFRLATIEIPDESGTLEIAISTLPMSSEWDDFLARNVNRWVGQLGQGALDSADVQNLIEEVETPSGTATVVELMGIDQTASHRNPHGNMGDPHGNLTTGARPLASDTPDGSTPPMSNSADLPFTFEVPKGWQPGQVGGMRKAAFQIAEAGKEAEVTVIDLPASGGAQITDVKANVQRWAGQVGLSLSESELQEAIEPRTFDEVSGSYVQLLGPNDGERPLGMLAAMFEQAGTVWFFKLMGDRELVEKQTEPFEQFLQSVDFR